jgi:uncharacterized damage-inducible protein DinB
MKAPPRPGRPRKYDFAPAPGFEHRDVGLAIAALDELLERLEDLISDLPDEALHFAPLDESNTIAMLVLHMAAGEAFWLARVTGEPLPEDVKQLLAGGMQDQSGNLPASKPDRERITRACREVRSLTKERLAKIADPDRTIEADGRSISVRGVLMHQIWHWTYHTGQVGLLRRLHGKRYRWTFDRRVAGPERHS